MTAAEIERLRINLLRQFKAADPMPLNYDALLVGARLEGFRSELRDIEIECDHLADPKLELIRRADAKFSRAVKRFKITAEGREWLSEQGF